MYGVIDGYDFGEMEPMRYFAPPASWSDEKKRDNARMKIYSGDFLGAEKKDGYFAKLIKDEDGNIILYSRSRGVNGQFADKHEWVPHLQPFFDALPNGTCLLGELYFPNKPGSRHVTSVMGCLKEKAIERQDKGEKLSFYAFDCLAWEGVSFMKLPAVARFNTLGTIGKIYQFGNVSFANYVTGEALWVMLQELLSAGHEGVVITSEDGKYEPGKRPSKTTLKIKKELKQTIDCFFTGVSIPATRLYTGKEIETWQYWENTITGEKLLGELNDKYKTGAPIIPVTKGHYHGWAGSLEIGVYSGDRIVSIGWLSGLPDSFKADVKSVAMRPIEVNAMEWDPVAHTLRHGKMVGFRPDLTVNDCTLEKIDG